MYRAAYALLLTTALFWAGNAIAGKLAVGHISPLLLTTLRWTLAVAILLPLAWKKLVEDWPVIRANMGLLFALGAIGFAIFNATFYIALNFTTAINVAIEQSGMPMVVFLANFVLFRMRVTWLQLMGFVLSIAGIALTASHGDLSRLAALQVNSGDALMMLAVLCYGGYTVALRFKPDIHWLSLITALAVPALITSLPFALGEYLLGQSVFPDARGWAVAAYTAILPSIVAQLCFIRGTELIGGNRASLFINLVPVFGTLLAVLIVGEQLQTFHIVAMALVLGGISLAEQSGRRMDRR